MENFMNQGIVPLIMGKMKGRLAYVFISRTNTKQERIIGDTFDRSKKWAAWHRTGEIRIYVDEEHACEQICGSSSLYLNGRRLARKNLKVRCYPRD
jgi:hypothetical protein